jgi:hypothetical protein
VETNLKKPQKDAVSYVAGSWTVPTVSCPRRGTSYAAFWVGIDGYSSSTVEQTGTLAECSNGVATYSAWYEFYPSPMYTISALTVRPGDVITAQVQFTGGSTLRLRLTYAADPTIIAATTKPNKMRLGLTPLGLFSRLTGTVMG